jgi:hypothetical protein
MQMFSSPWMLVLSQSMCVLGVGWVQWSWSGSVTLSLPFLVLLLVLYTHQMFLRMWNRLPTMPRDIRLYWGIAFGWSAVLIVAFVLTQPHSEVLRVAKVLPVLWCGIALMDWVLLVCMQQLVGHLWDEER